MPGAMIYAAGRVTNDLTYRESMRDDRHDFLSFTMAHNNGYPGEDGTWVQTSTLWLNVKAFGALARNARSVIAKGRPVLVHGELRHVAFVGSDNQQHNYLELKADGIGLNLRFCGSSYVGPGERNREIPEEVLAAARAEAAAAGDGAGLDTGGVAPAGSGSDASESDSTVPAGLGAGDLVTVGGDGDPDY